MYYDILLRDEKGDSYGKTKERCKDFEYPFGHARQ